MAAASAQCARGFGTGVPVAEGTDSVLMSEHDGVRVIDLNRPKALNALNAEMISVLLPRFREWQSPEAGVRMAVFRGVGGKAFCAGGDIRSLHQSASSGTPEGREVAQSFFREEYALNNTIGTSKMPVVSLYDGIVMGGGVGISVHGSIRVACETTTFAMPETGIGFFPDVGGTYFLPRLRGSLGIYLGLTGARLRGRDVLTSGVATHFVPSEATASLEALLGDCASEAAARGEPIDTEALSSAIRALDSGDGAGAKPPLLTEQSLAEIDSCFSRDGVPAITAAVGEMAAAAAASGDEKHWSVSAAKELARASPTSVHVTYDALIRGGRLETLAECLAMEYRMAQRFLKHPDFVSGVGAVLSKGKAEWVGPPSEEEVGEFFVAGEGGELSL